MSKYNIFVCILVLLTCLGLYTFRMITNSANIVKEAEDVIDIQKFYNNVYELEPLITDDDRISLDNYIAYSIKVEKDGVIMYVNIEGIPVETNDKYVRVQSKYGYALDKLLGYTYND